MLTVPVTQLKQQCHEILLYSQQIYQLPIFSWLHQVKYLVVVQKLALVQRSVFWLPILPDIVYRVCAAVVFSMDHSKLVCFEL